VQHLRSLKIFAAHEGLTLALEPRPETCTDPLRLHRPDTYRPDTAAGLANLRSR
jgi:hypothetical protein